MALKDSDRPIIVMGCPRSGTTLLQVMLHGHPRIAIPPENRFVLPAYRKRRDFGDLRKTANRRKFGKWITKSKKHKFEDFGLDPDEVIERVAASPPTIGSGLAEVLQAYADRFDKPRWGDKRPMYALHIDIIRKLFPQAKLVSIVRDGRDCVASLKEMSWYKHDLYYAATTWALSVDATHRAARKLGPDTFHEMSYERLVADPEPELRKLCAFLGEDYDPAMANSAETAAVAVPDRKDHHALTHQPVTQERVESWRERLDPWEISLCETTFGDRLRRYGYEPSGASSPGVGAQIHVRWVKTQRQWETVSRVTGDTFQRLRRERPVAAVLDEHSGAGAGKGAGDAAGDEQPSRQTAGTDN